jgi:hypothetical protein
MSRDDSRTKDVSVKSDTFLSWVTQTNEVLKSLRTEIVTANGNYGITGSEAENRNAQLIGTLNANVVAVTDFLRGGDVFNSALLTVSSNADFIGANVQIFANLSIENAGGSYGIGITEILSSNTLVESNTYFRYNDNSDAVVILRDTNSPNLRTIDVVAEISTIEGNVEFDTDTLFVDATNNRVGIGNSAPNARFHITSSVADDIIRVDDEASDVTYFVIDDEGKVAIGNTAPAARLHITSAVNEDILRIDDAQDDSTYLVMDDEGNIGIGNTTPAAKVHITNELGIHSFRVDDENQDSSPFVITGSGKVLVGSTASYNYHLPGYAANYEPGIQGAGTNYASGGAWQALSQWSTSTSPSGGAFLSLNKSNDAAVGTHAIVEAGQRIGGIGFAGSDGTNFRGTADIFSEVDGTPDTDVMPGRLIFATNSGGIGTSERMRITSAGFVGINTTSPIAPLAILANDTVANTNYYAMNIDMDVSGTDAVSVSNKPHTGLRIDLDSSATGGTTVSTEKHQVFGVHVDLDATGDSAEIRGYYASTKSTLSSGTTTNLRGVDASTEANPASGGTVSNAYGAYLVGLYGGVGTVNNLYGSYNRAEKQTDSGTSVLTNAHGAYNIAFNNASTPGADSTISTAYGSVNEVQVVGTHAQGVAVTNAQGVRSVIDVDTNRADVITAGYLFYGDYQRANASSVTNPWGIYLSGAADNYIEGDMVFNDNVKIGGSAGDTPLEKLHVSGTGQTILVTPVNYASNQNSPYLIAAGAGYDGVTSNWGAYGFQHRLKSNSGGSGRITVDTYSGEVFSINTSGVTVLGGAESQTVGDNAGTNITPQLQVHGTTQATSSLTLGNWASSATSEGALIFARSKSGTIGTKTVLADGDNLGSIAFSSPNVAGTAWGATAQIFVEVDGTPTTYAPGRLSFFTSNGSAATSTERMRIKSTGYVNITQGLNVGAAVTVTPTDTLDVDGTANISDNTTIGTSASGALITHNTNLVHNVSRSDSAFATTDNIFTFSKSTYKTARFTAQLSQGSEFQCSDFIVATDGGSDVYITVFGTVLSNPAGGDLGDFSVTTDGTNVIVQCTPTTATNTVATIYGQLFKT